jgi:hypothetical protein
MKTLEIQAIEFESAEAVLQYLDAGGSSRAILCQGKYLAVEPSEAERLETAGVEFAFVNYCVMRDDTFRIVTVPVND